jgi:hypothetical protein
MYFRIPFSIHSRSRWVHFVIKKIEIVLPYITVLRKGMV